MKKLLAVLALGATMAVPAHAGFVVSGGSTSAGLTTANIAAIGNDFAADITALFGSGTTSFNTSGLLSFAGGGTISIQLVALGSESGYADSLYSGNSPLFQENDPAGPHYYNSFITSISDNAANLTTFLQTLNFRTSANGAGGSNAPMGTTGFGYYFNPANTNSILLAFDDHNGSDDNHDDLLIKISVVPEPATWGLMILAFGLLGFAQRRRMVSA